MMTCLEAFERLLAAVREMSEIMEDQARIIEERNAIDEELARQLAGRRKHALSLISDVTEDDYD